MLHCRLLLLFLFAAVYGADAQQPVLPYKSKKTAVSTKGAVVSAHPLASAAGLAMLKKGGNAFDAAIATQFALAVVYPGAGNIGGGGFLVAHTRNGKNICIDYRETAPEKAHRDMYLDSAGNPKPILAQQGRLAAGVPGTVAGIFKTLPYARLPIATLIEPAIQLARKGFRITAAQAENLNKFREVFIKNNRHPIAFVKDEAWKEADLLIQEELAATLERIKKDGLKGFYKGETARLIVEEMSAGNGILSYNDLANYQAKFRELIDFEYKGHRIISASLPSSGGILLQQLLGMTGTKDIGRMGFQTAASVQWMVEAERRAYADRASFLGDADFTKVPLKKLVSRDYLQERINDFTNGKAGSSKDTRAGDVKESEETTHISIIDKEGNAVAVTTTLNDNFGCKTVVSGAGFLLNNEMDDFSIKEGFPNLYGVTGNAANAIAPGKRMLSSMTPTIVIKNNRPVIVVGSPGGSTIPTTVFQTLVNLIDFHLSPSEAVNKPKFHHQWLPDIIDTEAGFPVSVAKELEAMGYQLKARLPIGRTELICIDYSKGRKITSIADSRGDDSASAY
jgi:gamma-glutamyltranspeptidase/glutathione hydrolase